MASSDYSAELVKASDRAGEAIDCEAIDSQSDCEAIGRAGEAIDIAHDPAPKQYKWVWYHVWKLRVEQHPISEENLYITEAGYVAFDLGNVPELSKCLYAPHITLAYNMSETPEVMMALRDELNHFPAVDIGFSICFPVCVAPRTVAGASVFVSACLLRKVCYGRRYPPGRSSM